MPLLEVYFARLARLGFPYSFSYKWITTPFHPLYLLSYTILYKRDERDERDETSVTPRGY